MDESQVIHVIRFRQYHFTGINYTHVVEIKCENIHSSGTTLHYRMFYQNASLPNNVMLLITFLGVSEAFHDSYCSNVVGKFL